MTWDLVGPNRWRWNTGKVRPVAAPAPYVISDTMEPTEQVDGKFYTSKAKFRAIGRSLGLTEVGTERPKFKVRGPVTHETRRQRRQAFEKAIAEYRQGRRPRG